jgi:AcrR family transcriptional regulator
MPKISAARKDARRDEILAAAVRCFARQGFQKTTIHDICAEASLSVGAIYSYFASKDAIVAALADTGRRATARLVDNDTTAPPIERLRTLLGAFERAQDPTVYQLDVRAWGEAIGDERLRDMTLAGQAALVGRLAGLTESLATAAGLEPRALADLVAAVVVGCEVRKAISPDDDVGPLLDVFLALLEPHRRAQP